MEICKERFEAWLSVNPPDRSFQWGDTRDCAACCFLNETQGLIATSGGQFSSLWMGAAYWGAFVERIEWPDWFREVIASNIHDLTIANMQARYRELFPETPDLVVEPITETGNK